MLIAGCVFCDGGSLDFVQFRIDNGLTYIVCCAAKRQSCAWQYGQVIVSAELKKPLPCSPLAWHNAAIRLIFSDRQVLAPNNSRRQEFRFSILFWIRPASRN